jgi:hypothetical protein
VETVITAKGWESLGQTPRMTLLPVQLYSAARGPRILSGGKSGICRETNAREPGSLELMTTCFDVYRYLISLVRRAADPGLKRHDWSRNRNDIVRKFGT